MAQIGVLLGLGIAAFLVLRIGGVAPLEQVRRTPSPWVLPGQAILLSISVLAVWLLLTGFLFDIASRLANGMDAAITGSLVVVLIQLVILAVLLFFRKQACTPLLHPNQHLQPEPPHSPSTGLFSASSEPPRGEWGSPSPPPPPPNNDLPEQPTHWYGQPEMALRATATPRRPIHQLVSQSYLWFLIALTGAFSAGIIWAAMLKSLGVEPDSQEAVQILASTDNAALIILLTFTVVILAPLWEEIFFRGVILRHGSRYIGFWPALILSSTLFSLAHFLLVGIPVFIVLGLVFGLAYRATGTLITPILMHAFFNLNTVVLLRLYSDEFAHQEFAALLLP